MKKAWTILSIACALIVVCIAVPAIYWFNIGLFNNPWFNWFLTTYTVAILLVIGLIVFALKIAAIIDPRIPTNKIIDLIKDTLGTTGQFPTIPGVK